MDLASKTSVVIVARRSESRFSNFHDFVVLARAQPGAERAAQDPKFVATLRELGSIAAPGSPEAFGRIIDTEAKVAAQMVKEGRLKAE